MKIEKSNIPDRITGQQYQEYLATGRLPGQPERSSKPSKLHNIKTEYAGRVYDSKMEARVAHEYDLQQQTGSLIASIPQPSLPLTPKTGHRIRPDFMLIHEVFDDGTFRASLVDVKGYDTPGGRKNRNLFRQHYGIEVKLIQKKRNREKNGRS